MILPDPWSLATSNLCVYFLLYHSFSYCLRPKLFARAASGLQKRLVTKIYHHSRCQETQWTAQKRLSSAAKENLAAHLHKFHGSAMLRIPHCATWQSLNDAICQQKNCQSTRKHSPSQRIVMLRMPVPRKSGTWEARSPWLWPQTSMQLADVVASAA